MYKIHEHFVIGYHNLEVTLSCSGTDGNLYVELDGDVIEDSWGEQSYPDDHHLSGAALKSYRRKYLLGAGICSIKGHLICLIEDLAINDNKEECAEMAKEAFKLAEFLSDAVYPH